MSLAMTMPVKERASNRMSVGSISSTVLKLSPIQRWETSTRDIRSSTLGALRSMPTKGSRARLQDCSAAAPG